MNRIIFFLSFLLLANCAIPVRKPSSLSRSSIRKPNPSDKPQAVYRQCAHWAKVALSSKTPAKRLVLQFEGLAGYSRSLARELYRYQEELLLGRRSKVPKQVSVFSGAQNTMRVNMSDYYKGIEYLLLPFDTDTEMVARCVTAWSDVLGRDFKLKVAGHSFGGDGARRLVQYLDKHVPQVQEIDMIVLDSRAPLTGYSPGFWTPGNVRRNDVFLQKSLVLPGYTYKDKGGLTINHPKIVRKDIRAIKVPCKGSNNHMKMTCTPRVQKAYRDFLSR